MKGNHILHANYSACLSHIWKSILKSDAIVKSSFKIYTRKCEISVWYDKWIEDDYLYNFFPYIDIQDTQLQVKDLFLDGRWQWEILATRIPLHIIMCI